MMAEVALVPFKVRAEPTIPRKVEEAVVEVATTRPNCPTPPWSEAAEMMLPMSAGMVEVAVEVR
jgi:hypothetical protein